jgi:hypothetical protein
MLNANNPKSRDWKMQNVKTVVYKEGYNVAAVSYMIGMEALV